MEALGALHNVPLSSESGKPPRHLEVAFSITSIRRFASERRMPISPRPSENGVLWIETAKVRLP